jgi:hypothetical protein
MEYELIQELFNPCAGDKRPKTSICTVETEDLDGYVKQLLVGKDIRCEKFTSEAGSVIYELEIDGRKQRLTFTS